MLRSESGCCNLARGLSSARRLEDQAGERSHPDEASSFFFFAAYLFFPLLRLLFFLRSMQLLQWHFVAVRRLLDCTTSGASVRPACERRPPRRVSLRWLLRGRRCQGRDGADRSPARTDPARSAR